MGCFIALLVLCFAFAVLLYAARPGGHRARVLKQVAKRFHGQLYRPGLFGDGHVRFPYGGAHVRVYSVGTRYAPELEIGISWPDTRQILEVFIARPLSPSGFSQEQFEEDYLFRSDSEESARRLLVPSVQAQIDNITRLGGLSSHNIYLCITRGQFFLRKRLFPYQPQDVLRLVEWTLELHDQAMLTRCVGIEFVEEPAADSSTTAICPVCGDGISVASDAVYCERCRTPHHRDCWMYYGACTTYGCQTNRYTATLPVKPSAISTADSQNGDRDNSASTTPTSATSGDAT